MSLLLFKSTYQENGHILTLALYHCFSFMLCKVSHTRSLGFVWAAAESCTGCALPKDIRALGQGRRKPFRVPTLHVIHPRLAHCSKRHIVLIHTQSFYEFAGVLML